MYAIGAAQINLLLNVFACGVRRCPGAPPPSDPRLLSQQCAVKGVGLQRVQLPPGNWFAPPGSNRGGSGGNKAVGALGVKGRLATPRACRP
jgi:hypothetical protein